MLTLAFWLATIGLAPDAYGEVKITGGAVASRSRGDLDEYVNLIEKRDEKGAQKLIDCGKVFRVGQEAWATDWSGYVGQASIRPTEGPYDGQTIYVRAKDVRQPDHGEVEARERRKREREAAEAADRLAREVAERERLERERRAWEAARAARGPIDPARVARDLRAAISAATDASFRKRNAAFGRDRLIGMAIEEVRLRHVLEPAELLKVANDAKVFVRSGGRTFDVAGRPLRERLGEGR